MSIPTPPVQMVPPLPVQPAAPTPAKPAGRSFSLAAYAKGIAAGLGAAATALQPIYGAERWYVAIPAAATFFATVAVTNAAKAKS